MSYPTLPAPVAQVLEARVCRAAVGLAGLEATRIAIAAAPRPAAAPVWRRPG